MEETSSKEIYENTHSLLKEMLTEMSFKVDAGLSFKFSPSEKSMSGNTSSKVGLEFEYEKKNMIKDVSEISIMKVKKNTLLCNPSQIDPMCIS